MRCVWPHRGDPLTPTPTFVRNGTVGIARVLDNGDLEFVSLRRVRTHRNQGRNGRCRWYNDHELPDWAGGGTITVRLHQNDSDTRRELNRTENVRPIPPDDPDFEELYARRNDAESINRHLEDTVCDVQLHRPLRQDPQHPRPCRLSRRRAS